MFFVYGDLYTHDTAEVEFTSSKQTLYDDAERIIGWLERWNLTGHILEDTPANISATQTALRNAYCNPAGVSYAGLYISAGVPTDHYWLAQNTMSGIKVVTPPGYPNGTRIEFVNDRTYVVSLEAELINPNAKNVIAWTETLSQQGGGGQRVVAIETRYDLPVIQRTSRYSPIRLIQQGSAMGRFSYPAVPGPYLPEYTNDAETVISRMAPRLRGNRYERFEVQWSYVMNVAQTPGPAYPGRWPKFQ